MSDFINTIDVLGDDAVMDSLIDRSITEFKDDEITTIGTYAMYGCESLTTLELPNVTSVGTHAFHNCVSLKNVDLPMVGAFGEYCFQGCTSLEELRLPNIGLVNVTDSGRLYHGIVAQCTSLRKVDFGFSKLSFSRTTQFTGCSSLIAIIMRRTDDINHPSSSISLADTPIASGAGFIYVPRALVDSYKSATNWSTYASQFRAIEDYSVDGTLNGAIYCINNNLSCIVNNNTSDICKSTTYAATLIPDDGLMIGSVNITMGGVDITNSAYDGNGNIYIDHVTDSIEISAYATGLLLNVTPYDGSENGYLPAYRLNVIAGQTLQLTYYLTNAQGYLYDAKSCGGKTPSRGNNTYNVEATTVIEIAQNGSIVFSNIDYTSNNVANGELAPTTNDRLYGKYLKVYSI